MPGPLRSSPPLRRILFTALGSLVVSSCATVSGAAERAATRATGREVADRVDRTIGAAADRTEEAVRGSEGDPASAADAAPVRGTTPAPTGAGSEGGAVVAANVGFDFEPGSRELFTTSFDEDNVGDFPRALTWRSGNMEVVEWEGRRLLRATDKGALSIMLPETLPDRFTLEMVAHVPGTGSVTVLTGALPSAPWYQDYPAVNFGAWRGSGVYSEAGNPMATNSMEPLREGVTPVRIMMDGQHLKVYQGDRRVANVPQIDLPRTDAIHLMFDAREDRIVYVGDIRIAAGGRDLYDLLATEGRFTAEGIEFDTGSDRIRPSSKATLDEIGAMLVKHPDLSLVIEGHTDSQGGEASNLSLSERRAASVRDYLIETYGVEGGRLESAGFGEARPVASNETTEGRQQNRRVEIVRAGAVSPTTSAARATTPSSTGTSSVEAAAEATELGRGSTIGEVQLDGVGVLEVFASADGQSVEDAFATLHGQQPTAFWQPTPGRGLGRLIVYAPVVAGDQTRGAFFAQIGVIREGVLDPASHVVYHEPGPLNSRRRHLGEGILVEALELAANGSYAVRIRFDGTGSIISNGPRGLSAPEQLGAVAMKGAIVLDGLPVRTLSNGAGLGPAAPGA